MVKHREQPGPQEFLVEDRSAWVERATTPDGTMPGMDPEYHPLHRVGGAALWAQIDREDASPAGGEGVRRTSLERDNVRPVGPINRPAEEREDRSTDDGQRENVLDPTQDESGPQSDQA